MIRQKAPWGSSTENRAPGRGAILRTSALGLVVLVLSGAHCSSRAGGSTSSDGVSIPECDAYAAAFARCNGSTAPGAIELAQQATNLAQADDVTRARMKSTCERDLQRLHEACR